MNTGRPLRLLAALLALHAPAALAADPPKCRLIRIAEWPVKLQRGLPLVEGAINGKKVGVLLDTGAYASLITKASAERLGLPTRATAEVMAGVGGLSQVHVTRIDTLTIAGATREGMRVRVGGERPIPGVDFVLGDDFFRMVDIEFDYAKGVIRLFQPEGCDGRALGYWDPKAMQLPMERDSKIVVPIKVNGRSARALLDSGASSSMVALHLAEDVGVRPGGQDVAPSGCSSGIGADLVRSWVARFDTVEIGEQVVRDPRLHVAEVIPELAFGMNAVPEVILGTDFFRAHRVYVARGQRKVYFTYTGGLIFPTTPALDCDSLPSGKDQREVRAGYDRAIAANPRDVTALIRRAPLRMLEEGTQGGLEDLDRAIRIEPGNAVALRLRSEVRGMAGDYKGALADSGAAILHGMRNAPMYYRRGLLHRALDDVPRAIEEHGRALELDPRFVPALESRGRHLYHAGRFEAADKDFAAALAIRASGIDSIWLALARAHRGIDGAPVLEEGLARLKDGKWPAPVMLFLLGRLDREGLMARAASTDDKARKEQECEARYYMAARLLAAGKPGEARPLLVKAAGECPTNFIEYDGAVIELERMK